MRFVIQADDQLLDASVELESNAIVLLSRGGTKGTSNSQNQDYPTALRLILQRLERYGRAITGVWVDSAPVQSLPRAERQILSGSDFPANAATLFSLLGRRMERVGRAPTTATNKGNRNKRLRIEVATESIGELASVIGAKACSDVPRSAIRLPAASLRQVTEFHIWAAIDKVRSDAANHNFGDALDYDLVVEDGALLAPNAVFGVAATLALGFPVQPVNFTGGKGTICFDALEAAGWSIVKKGTAVPGSQPISALSSADEEWAEGDERRLSHLRRERHSGVVKAKKAKMREQYGKLFCEQCQMDPVAEFGSVDGEACIEVHHRETEVAQMMPGHRTKMADVECLCANCHRVRHRQIKTSQTGPSLLSRDRRS